MSDQRGMTIVKIYPYHSPLLPHLSLTFVDMIWCRSSRSYIIKYRKIVLMYSIPQRDVRRKKGFPVSPFCVKKEDNSLLLTDERYMILNRIYYLCVLLQEREYLEFHLTVSDCYPLRVVFYLVT